MDRLTVRMAGETVPVAYEDKFILDMDKKTYSAYSETIERLAAYEDTGLSPEKIAALVAENKRLHELLSSIEDVLKGK